MPLSEEAKTLRDISKGLQQLNRTLSEMNRNLGKFAEETTAAFAAINKEKN